MASDHLSLIYCIVAIRRLAKDAAADKNDKQVSKSIVCRSMQLFSIPKWLFYVRNVIPTLET